MPPSARASPPSGTWPAIGRTACRRRSRGFRPVGEAVPAKAREIHHVDVLHVGAAAKMLDQPAVDGGLELDPSLIVGSHDLLRVLTMTKITAAPAAFQTPNPMTVTTTVAPRELLASLFRTAVAAAHPAQCLPPNLPEPPAGGRLIVLAAGKAAGSMTEVAERHYLHRVPPERLSGIAVTRHGYGRPTRHIAVVEAGHPVPDEAGLNGTERALDLAQAAGADDLVLVLLSGGASANWIAPAAGITLAEKQ